jgi:hypothetical protein
MLEQYSSLLEEHTNLKNDYTSERDIRRNYQKAVDHMQRQVQDTHRQLVSPSCRPMWGFCPNRFHRKTIPLYLPLLMAMELL